MNPRFIFKQSENKRSSGLIGYHSYVVTDVTSVKINRRGNEIVNLVRLYNVWGQGSTGGVCTLIFYFNLIYFFYLIDNSSLFSNRKQSNGIEVGRIIVDCGIWLTIRPKQRWNSKLNKTANSGMFIIHIIWYNLVNERDSLIYFSVKFKTNIIFV